MQSCTDKKPGVSGTFFVPKIYPLANMYPIMYPMYPKKCTQKCTYYLPNTNFT